MTWTVLKTAVDHAFLETTLIYAQIMPSRERSECELYKPANV
jgi:hypothetical protein